MLTFDGMPRFNAARSIASIHGSAHRMQTVPIVAPWLPRENQLVRAFSEFSVGGFSLNLAKRSIEVGGKAALGITIECHVSEVTYRTAARTVSTTNEALWRAAKSPDRV